MGGAILLALLRMPVVRDSVFFTCSRQSGPRAITPRHCGDVEVARHDDLGGILHLEDLS
jgi:hypothetical protein